MDLSGSRWTEEEQRQRREFRRKLDELCAVITDALAYFSAWRGLMIENEETVEALNRYRGFFLPVRNALHWMSLTQFAKVFDRDRRTVSMRTLVAEAKAGRPVLAPYCDEQELEQIERQVDTDEALLDALKSLRDKRLAHHDATMVARKPLLYGQVEQLLESVKSMFNVLWRGHDRNVVSFGRLCEQAETSTSGVVRIVCEERDRARQRYEEAAKLVESTSDSTDRRMSECSGAHTRSGGERNG